MLFLLSGLTPIPGVKHEEEGGHIVLRISRDASPTGKVVLWLEGQVSGPWVEELRRSCEQALAMGSDLSLDLTDVSFIDRDGLVLCGNLKSRHVTFLHCSPFVMEQLKQ